MQLSLLELFSDTPAIPVPRETGLTREELRDHIPEAAIGYILHWFETHTVRLRFAPARSSKFGDYRFNKPGIPATISVNRNLNPYDFLITLVHEMAHDEVLGEKASIHDTGLFKRRKSRPRPHGKEWKEKYRELMAPLISANVFPQELLAPLREYFLKVNASAKASQDLAIALKRYDTPDGKEFLQDLPLDAIFYMPGGKAFRKKEKVRKRFRCQSLTNRRIYLFSPLAAVSRNQV